MRFVFVLILSAIWSTAIAADNREEAKHHFDVAEKAMNAENYRLAADEYEASYNLYPAPALLWNLGQSYRQFDQKKALHYYRLYIEAAKPGTRTPPAPTTAPPPAVTAQQLPLAPVTRDWYRSGLAITGFSLVGLALVSCGVGTGLLAHGNDLNSQVASATSIPQGDAAAASRDSFWNGSYAMFAIGGASAIAGAALLAVAGSRRRHRQTSFSVAPSVGGGIVLGVGGSL